MLISDKIDTYRPDIDGLRALAIISVVAFHAFPSLIKGGFVGVDVFFVISGYLITLTLLKDFANNSFSFINFYQRRIRRIFPALLTVLFCSFLAGWFLLFPDELKQLGRHISGGAFFISNFVLWHESGYFDVLSETKPLLHLWSLGIEEQFYILYPIILWFTLRVKKNIFFITCSLALISFVLGILFIKSNPVASYYSPIFRSWEILLGSILAFLRFYKRHPGEIKSDTNFIVSLIGILLLILAFFSINKDQSFPGWWALLPTVATMLLIQSEHSWINRKVFSSPVLVWIGKISYPLYLWHWGVLSFARILSNKTPSVVTRLNLILLSIIASWLTYKFIETRLRYSKVKRITLVMAGVLAGFGSVGFFLHFSDGVLGRQIAKDRQAIMQQFEGPLWKYEKNETCLRKYPFKGAQTFEWWFCITNSAEVPKILITGNSFANHYYPGLLKSKIGSHAILSLGTCDPAWVENGSLLAGPPTKPCSGNRMFEQQEMIDAIIRKEAIPYVIIAGLPEEPSADYIKRIKKRIDRIETFGSKVILFYPHIKPTYDIKSCFARPLMQPENSCFLSTKDYISKMNLFLPLVKDISKSNPKVKFFNPNEAFCNEHGCKYTINGLPIFRDQYHHLSDVASTEVGERFTKWVKTSIK